MEGFQNDNWIPNAVVLLKDSAETDVKPIARISYKKAETMN